MYPKIYFRNGITSAEKAQLSIASAPVLYGLSIYTVFPVFLQARSGLAMFRLPDHFKRLRNSAKIMAFDDFLAKWDYTRFERAMHELIAENNPGQDTLVRVSIFVDEELKGARSAGLKNSLAAFAYPATQLLPAEGAKLCISSWRRTPDNSIPSRAKINGSYVNAALMKNEALLNGFDDAIALDGQGHVTESTVSNIFMARDGRLITPAGSTDLLEGITRDTVFKLAAHLNIECEQRDIDRSELYLADEVFLCGSSMGLTPVTEIDHRALGSGKPGPLTAKLAAVYQKGSHSGEGLFKAWLTQV